jgi:hypothetical protein
MGRDRGLESRLKLTASIFATGLLIASCTTNSPQSKIQRQTTAVIGDVDNRETFPNYSKAHGIQLRELEAKYSATGVLFCGNKESTFNLVKRNNLIVFPAHRVLDTDLYGKYIGQISDQRLRECYVRVFKGESLGKKHYSLNLTKTVKVGPLLRLKTHGNDWAIAELKESISGVSHYDVAPPDSQNEFAGLTDQKVTIIAARNENFQNYPYETRTICDGKIGFVRSVADPLTKTKKYHAATDCSGGNGGSGGPILALSADGTPLFLGMITGSFDSEADHKPFGYENYTGGPLLTGEFLEALNSF